LTSLGKAQQKVTNDISQNVPNAVQGDASAERFVQIAESGLPILQQQLNTARANHGRFVTGQQWLPHQISMNQREVDQRVAQRNEIDRALQRYSGVTVRIRSLAANGRP
jgi:ubiquinone biosynthesis protein UbiJ